MFTHNSNVEIIVHECTQNLQRHESTAAVPVHVTNIALMGATALSTSQCCDDNSILNGIKKWMQKVLYPTRFQVRYEGLPPETSKLMRPIGESTNK